MKGLKIALKRVKGGIHREISKSHSQPPQALTSWRPGSCNVSVPKPCIGPAWTCFTPALSCGVALKSKGLAFSFVVLCLCEVQCRVFFCSDRTPAAIATLKSARPCGRASVNVKPCKGCTVSSESHSKAAVAPGRESLRGGLRLDFLTSGGLSEQPRSPSAPLTYMKCATWALPRKGSP